MKRTSKRRTICSHLCIHTYYSTKPSAKHITLAEEMQHPVSHLDREAKQVTSLFRSLSTNEASYLLSVMRLAANKQGGLFSLDTQPC